ncbi:hypothetical protein LCGC14_0142750 [marine sediment metagenome]|uniref:Radical SAM core domain-containing protein n=1 Tax=marine sediment metagenome TaxID=412755 RepID=A0A0F9V1A8_9ZZZZ
MSKHETTIRLTNFCNETCDHCMFRSGPSNKTHMTEKMSQQLNEWLPKGVDSNISVMGGEVSLIPNYGDLMRNTFQGHYQGGIMTNGVFVKQKATLDEFVRVILSLDTQNITIRISQSQFHSKDGYGQEAFEKLKQSFKHKHRIFVQFAGDLGLNIVLVGRAYDNNVPSKYQDVAMCDNAMNDNMFVDENGIIHWCPLGESPYKHFSQCDYYETREKMID